KAFTRAWAVARYLHPVTLADRADAGLAAHVHAVAQPWLAGRLVVGLEREIPDPHAPGPVSDALGALGLHPYGLTDARLRILRRSRWSPDTHGGGCRWRGRRSR